MTAERLCACGCRTSMEGRDSRALYATNACKSRAYKARTGYKLAARRSRRQTPTRKPRPGVTVYIPTIAQAKATRRALAPHGHLADPITQALKRKQAKAT